MSKTIRPKYGAFKYMYIEVKDKDCDSTQTHSFNEETKNYINLIGL